MKTLRKNNRNPHSLSYTECETLLTESRAEDAGDTVGVGNNTVAWQDEVGAFHIKFFDTVVAILHDEETVTLYTGGYQTETTKRRLDWVLLPLGYRVVSKNAPGSGRRRWGQSHDEFRLYRIKDGMYLDFHEGMTVVKR